MKIQHEAEGYLELGLPRQALQVLSRLGDGSSARCLGTLQSIDDKKDASANNIDFDKKIDATRSLDNVVDALATNVSERFPEIFPDKADVRTLYLQGEALRSLERYTDAIVPLRKVAELEPENIQVRLALGWCHKRTGRIDLAIEALEGALRADNDEPLIRYNLACYHSVAGDKRQALAYLEQALTLDPKYRADR